MSNQSGNAGKIYEFEVKTIKGESIKLDRYKGKTLLIVNVASECGLTGQYEGLEALYKKFKANGLEILGFPCNQFGGQEPGDEAKIEAFCTARFGVSFPMFAKIDVNGDTAHPLYEYLKSEEKGILGTEAIKWNFTKFLVNKDGSVLKRYAPTTGPESISQEIEKLLSL